MRRSLHQSERCCFQTLQKKLASQLNFQMVTVSVTPNLHLRHHYSYSPLSFTPGSQSTTLCSLSLLPLLDLQEPSQTYETLDLHDLIPLLMLTLLSCQLYRNDISYRCNYITVVAAVAVVRADPG